MIRTTTRGAATCALLTMAVLTALPASAQVPGTSSGTVSAVLAGYGTANYGGTFADAYAHDFSTSVSPILLFGAGDDVLFEAEFEFGLEGGETTTALEYAQIDYLGFERFQFSFGKFLLPFGVFGERLHPSWINRMPTMPALYGHAHGGVAEGALLPILSDLGFMGRANVDLGGRTHLDVSLYVTQGPMIVEEHAEEAGGGAEDGHVHGVAPGGPFASPGHDGEEPVAGGSGEPFEIPLVAFGIATSDNNQNKMIGARVGVVTAPGLEVYLSGFHAMYDPGAFMDYTGANLTVEWRGGGTEVRGEGVLLRQEFQNDDVFDTLEQTGYYLQVARRYGDLEPVARWSQLLDGKVGEDVARPGRKELALGLNYWVSQSVPLKIAYAFVPDFDDRVLVQWAFGF